MWVREVYNSAYVAFTGIDDINKISAEMYCNGDVVHYDNLDYARGLTDGGTVYCVAFNALKPVIEEPIDVCPNIDGVQSVIPEGMQLDGEGQCIKKEQDDTATLTVIKHVVNDNGGTKQASEFTLRVNIPVEEENFGMNTLIDWFVPKTAYAMISKLFAPANFSGNEEGTTVYFHKSTNYNVTEDQHTGYTTTMSEDCTGTIALGEHKTCTVTNDDIAPPITTGGVGSSTYDYWGCTNQAASNFNRLANRNDGSCQLPPPPSIITTSKPATTTSEKPKGEVLGASTVVEPTTPTQCTEYLHDYLKMGKKNDPREVKLLQSFLNDTLDAKLPVTGFFGNLTKNWVKKFQKKYYAEIIMPWLDAGYKGRDIQEGTGNVFQTTKRQINLMKCTTLNIPMPDLSTEI